MRRLKQLVSDIVRLPVKGTLALALTPVPRSCKPQLLPVDSPLVACEGARLGRGGTEALEGAVIIAKSEFKCLVL
jgi:hypothetical protein